MYSLPKLWYSLILLITVLYVGSKKNRNCLSVSVFVLFKHIFKYSPPPSSSFRPRGLTFTWWGCCGLSLWLKQNRACPLLFILFLCLFLSLWPFNCISFHKFSRPLSAFSLCSSGLISALLILSIIYLFMKVSVSPDITILCGWLGLKHQLTN